MDKLQILYITKFRSQKNRFFINVYKSMNLSQIFFLTFLITLSKCQSCLDQNGKSVYWWVKILFPGSVPGGYAYFDSTFTIPSFKIYKEEEADSINSPLARTLDQINILAMQTAAWNDQIPNGTSSSSKAHSKGVLTYQKKSQKGFFLCHSIPKYPYFNQSFVNTKIDQNQKIYGQHAFCLSGNKTLLSNMIIKILPIRPLFYVNKLLSLNEINNLRTAAAAQTPDYKSLFTYNKVIVNKTTLQFIYKNGAVNASIFEDGLVKMLKSSINAETWGRPLQSNWCTTLYSVNNIKSLKFTEQIKWNGTQDHSKWAYALKNNYSCFGDMNRMTSQWKRGGAFYCINSAPLKKALAAISETITAC